MLRKKFYCYCHGEGQFLSNCQLLVLELSGSETLFTSLGLKRKQNGSQFWKDQKVGQVQAQRNPQVSASLSLLSLLPCLLHTLNLWIESHHQHLDFIVDISLQEKL